MMSQKLVAIPAALKAKVKEIEKLTKPVCKRYLDAEYQRLAGVVLHRLATQTDISFTGKAEGWAGGILWALFEHNMYHAAPTPTGEMLQEVFAVSQATLRHRKKDVIRLLDMEQEEGSSDYMHADIYQMLEQMLGLDQLTTDAQQVQTLSLQFPADMPPEQQASVVAQFEQALNQLMQTTPQLDMAKIHDLAAQFGISVHLDQHQPPYS